MKKAIQYFLIVVTLSFSTLVSMAQTPNQLFEEARTSFTMMDYVSAIAKLDAAIESSPNQSYYYHFRGMSYFMMKDYPSASKDYRKALELNPNEATTQYSLGLCEMMNRNYAAAIAPLSKAIELNPNYAKAYQDRADIYMNLGDYEKAKPDYEKLLSINPNNFSAKDGLEIAEMYLSNGDNNPAITPNTNQNNTQPTNTNPATNVAEVKPTTNTKEPTKEVIPTTENPVIGKLNTTPEEETTPTDPIDERLAIFWISPDPDEFDGKSFVAESDIIDIKLKALSTTPLEENQFSIVLNGQDYAPKFNEIQIRSKQNSSTFTYTNRIKLKETPNHINTLQIKLTKGTQVVASTTLQIFYNPAKPNLHVISIGTKPLNLKYPDKDAKDFADLFANQAGSSDQQLFGQVHVKSLVGEAATSSEIQGLLEEYKFTHDVSPRDLLIVFLSSHGFMYNEEFRIQGNEYDPRRKRTTSVSYNSIIRNLNDMECKKLVMIDACQSGGAKASTEEIYEAIAELNQAQNGITTITSSSKDQLSYEDTTWENGAFTEAIINGLQNAQADENKDDIISVQELFDYVRMQVPQMVRKVKNEIQTPNITSNELGDLPFYLIQK